MERGRGGLVGEKGEEQRDKEVEKNGVGVRDEEETTGQTEDEKKVRRMDELGGRR